MELFLCTEATCNYDFQLANLTPTEMHTISSFISTLGLSTTYDESFKLGVAYKRNGGDTLAVYQELMRLANHSTQYNHIFLPLVNFIVVNYPKIVKKKEESVEAKMRKMEAELQYLRQLTQQTPALEI